MAFLPIFAHKTRSRQPEVTYVTLISSSVGRITSMRKLSVSATDGNELPPTAQNIEPVTSRTKMPKECFVVLERLCMQKLKGGKFIITPPKRPSGKGLTSEEVAVDSAGTSEYVPSQRAENKDYFGRRYLKWHPEETSRVQQYFDKYIREETERSLPGKAEVLIFLKNHPSIKYDWEVVKTKVMNEKKARKRKLDSKHYILNELPEKKRKDVETDDEIVEINEENRAKSKVLKGQEERILQLTSDEISTSVLEIVEEQEEQISLDNLFYTLIEENENLISLDDLLYTVMEEKENLISLDDLFFPVQEEQEDQIAQPRSDQISTSTLEILAKQEEQIFQPKSSEISTSALEILAKQEEQFFQPKSSEISTSALAILAKQEEQTFQPKSSEISTSALEEQEEQISQPKSDEISTSALETYCDEQSIQRGSIKIQQNGDDIKEKVLAKQEEQIFQPKSSEISTSALEEKEEQMSQPKSDEIGTSALETYCDEQSIQRGSIKIQQNGDDIKEEVGTEDNPSNRFPCPICGLSYKFKESFFSHVSYHMKGESHLQEASTNPPEDVDVEIMSSAVHHSTSEVDTEDNPSNIFPCPICGLSYKFKESFLRHVYYHIKGESHLQEASTNPPEDVDVEIMSSAVHHSTSEVDTEDNPSNIFPCPICGLSYKFKESFLRHVYYHIKGESHLQDEGTNPPKDVDVEIMSSAVHQSTSEDCNSKRVINTKTTRGKYNSNNRPARRCIFCSKICSHSNLGRHIKLAHKDNPRVAAALKLPRDLRNSMFADFRKEGIFKENVERLGKNSNAPLERERRQNVDRKQQVMCENCHAVITAKAMPKHRRHCRGGSLTKIKAIPISIMVQEDEDMREDFVSNILSRFLKDDIGHICQSDWLVKKFGSLQWTKFRVKQDQIAQVRKSVMNDMRRLANVYKCFKEEVKPDDSNLQHSAVDMFNSDYFTKLQNAISNYTQVENEQDKTTFTIKHGLKNVLYYIIKNAAATLQTHYFSNPSLRNKASDVKLWIDNFATTKNVYFYDSLYQIRKNRQINLRKPCRMPDTQVLSVLVKYCLERIQSFLKSLKAYRVWTRSDYVELRDVLVCRLTVFNARRGGEACRLLFREFDDAVHDRWIDKKYKEHHDIIRLNMKLTYQAGKGMNHIVPVLFPIETFRAVQLLIDQDLRAQIDIAPNNQYVFANVYKSDTYVNGWDAIQKVARQADIPDEDRKRLNATLIRHYTSTEVASMDIPEADKEFFFQHMGHSAQMNLQTYQSPLALKEITTVGKHLKVIDAELITLSGDTTKDLDSKPKPMVVEGGSTNDNDITNVAQLNGETVSMSGEPPTDGDGKPKSVIAEDGSPNDTDCTKSAWLNEVDTVSQEKISTCYKRKETTLNGVGPIYQRNTPAKNARIYRRWSRDETELIQKYFDKYIEDRAERPYPGKAELQAFLLSHPEIKYSVNVVKTKVMNEKKERIRKIERGLQQLKPNME